MLDKDPESVPTDTPFWYTIYPVTGTLFTVAGATQFNPTCDTPSLGVNPVTVPGAPAGLPITVALLELAVPDTYEMK
jgi:hypothetical protein